MQATKRNSAPFLTTTRTLNNSERLFQWERRKQKKKDTTNDDQLFLFVWIASILIVGMTFLYMALAEPRDCIWIWGSNGIECIK